MSKIDQYRRALERRGGGVRTLETPSEGDLPEDPPPESECSPVPGIGVGSVSEAFPPVAGRSSRSRDLRPAVAELGAARAVLEEARSFLNSASRAQRDLYRLLGLVREDVETLRSRRWTELLVTALAAGLISGLLCFSMVGAL